MALYEGTLRVQVISVLADDRCGVVRVAERAERPGEGLSYSGVHVWELRDGRCCSFESLYGDSYSRLWSARSSADQDRLAVNDVGDGARRAGFALARRARSS